MILNLLELIFKILEWGIRMPKNAFGCLNVVFEYQKEHLDMLEAISRLMRRRVSGCLEEAFGCPRGHSDAEKRLLYGGYPDARNVHLDIH